MTNWTPCPILVGEADPWSPDECSRRRRLSGVAQGIEDLRAVTAHFGRDPDEAVAAWETYARDADDDGVATFNAFCREWNDHSSLAAIVQSVQKISAGTAASFAGCSFQLAGAAWQQFIPAVEQNQRITDRLANTAQALGLEIAAVQDEFREYAASQPFPIADSLPYFLNRLHCRVGSTPITLSVILPASPPAPTPRRCYRCAESHGSKPCRQAMRGRVLARR